MFWLILFPLFSFFGKIFVERFPLFYEGNPFWKMTWKRNKTSVWRFLPFCAFDSRIIIDICLIIIFLITQNIFFVFLSVCLIVCWVDAKSAHLPEDILMPLFLLGLLASPIPMMDRIIGCTAGYFVMRIYMELISFRKPGNYAGGDITFMLMAGAWLGPNILFVLLMCPVFFVIEGILLGRFKQGHPMRPSFFVSVLIMTMLMVNHISIWSMLI